MKMKDEDEETRLSLGENRRSKTDDLKGDSSYKGGTKTVLDNCSSLYP